MSENAYASFWGNKEEYEKFSIEIIFIIVNGLEECLQTNLSGGVFCQLLKCLHDLSFLSSNIF